jgi:CCCH-type zinc finger
MNNKNQLCRDHLAGRCRRGDKCRFLHALPPRKHKNTESFEPMTRPVDMRVVLDLGREKLTTPLSTRDVLLVPNIFADFAPGELYAKLENEILNCGIPESELLKLWHGDSHFIADDHLPWKRQAPTFAMVVDRLRTFFSMDVKATRFNWYKDTAQWKPFHFDAAAVDPKKAETQNFTVAVSFGATRDAAFEDARTKTVVSMPQPDGYVYAFCKDTNILWRHGILKDPEPRKEGRISVIAWGKI